VGGDAGQLTGREKSERVEQFMPLPRRRHRSGRAQRRRAAHRRRLPARVRDRLVARAREGVAPLAVERAAAARGGTAEKTILIAAIQGNYPDLCWAAREELFRGAGVQNALFYHEKRPHGGRSY
jgi:hypothetical protein